MFLSTKNLMASRWEKLSSSSWNSCNFATNKNSDETQIVDIPPRDIRDKDKVVTDYEAKLWEAKRSALISALFHKLTHFMGICTIILSIVVLLGGFAGDLPRLDFYVVVTLLILEVGRFGCTIFFTQLLRMDLVHNSQNPQHLSYKDIRQEIVSLLRFLSPLGQIISLLSTLSLLLWRYLLPASNFAGFRGSNLTVSMHFFYLLILFNTLLVTVAALVSAYHHRRVFSSSKHCSDVIIQRYFDEVMWRALHAGLAYAGDFNVFEFAFDVQAQDYRCNVQPLVVQKAYGEFFGYLLAHRIGLDILSKYLESDDCFKQQAAANIVGFWCNINNPHLKQSLPRLSNAFLQNLLCKMETCSQIGWNVANSLTLLVPIFKILSREAGQDYMYKLYNLTSSDGKDVVEFLTSKLDPKDSWSISYLRLLATLFHNINDRSLINLKTDKQEFCVRQILDSDKSRSRTKMYATYVLLMAGKNLKLESINGILVRERKDSYFLVHEVYMLDHIRESCDMKPLKESDWRNITMRGEVKSPFYFEDTISIEPSSSIKLLCMSNQTMSLDSKTLSPKSGILSRLCDRVLLAYQHLWARGVGDPSKTKTV